MITIGADFGGPELKGTVVRDAVLAAMNVASDTRRKNYDDGTSGWINPIFLVPGSITQPDFEGYKIGHFSAKRKGVVVMIAVPESAALGDQVHFRIYSLLHGATRLAASFFAEKNIAFDHDECARVLTAVAERLRVDPNKLWVPSPQNARVSPGRSNGLGIAWRCANYLARAVLVVGLLWVAMIVILIVARDYR
ncbi:hypothetical protein ASE66_13015 [Bosea sp. Root483D1]|uniref:hypothetical protein n=1 Tax=Bosea sp. Root483D1 TaxID=1736544 RepID=UPI00070A8603|nr:hypothetical protein [Bosea sp. Root483D1]KRE14306.1 hypothetical protein ASE66_13015 [Bosea sp. Root483D1]